MIFGILEKDKRDIYEEAKTMDRFTNTVHVICSSRVSNIQQEKNS